MRVFLGWSLAFYLAAARDAVGTHVEIHRGTSGSCISAHARREHQHRPQPGGGVFAYLHTTSNTHHLGAAAKERGFLRGERRKLFLGNDRGRVWRSSLFSSARGVELGCHDQVSRCRVYQTAPRRDVRRGPSRIEPPHVF